MMALGCAATTVTRRAIAVRPAGEPRSFLTPHDLRVVVDHRTLRMLPFSDDVDTLYRVSGIFQRFAGGVGVDPLRDIDRVGASTREAEWTSRGVVGERWRLVLRHRLPDEDAIARLERSALANGDVLRWRESQGLRSALLPDRLGRGVPHVLLLSAASELVVVPEDELIDAVTTVRDHAGRRTAPDQVIEPALALDPGVFVEAEGTVLPRMLETIGASHARGTARWTGARVEVHLVISFADEGSASSARTAFETQIASFRGNNPFLTSLGIAGWVERLSFRASGRDLVVDTSGDAAEAGALARAIAMAFAS